MRRVPHHLHTVQHGLEDSPPGDALILTRTAAAWGQITGSFLCKWQRDGDGCFPGMATLSNEAVELHEPDITQSLQMGTKRECISLMHF